MARVYPNNSKGFVVIDSREAKICKTTNCAKFYLPVIIENGPVPRPWDEVDLRGKIVQGDRYPYFAAETVLANLGHFQ